MFDNARRIDLPHAVRFASYLAGVYLIIGCLWITFSDLAIIHFVNDPQVVTHLQTKKGWAFILITGVLLWGLTYRRYNALQRAEDERLSALQNLRVLFDASPSAIVATDEDGNVTAWNRAAERLFGWTETQALGRLNPIIPQQDLPVTRQLWRTVMDGGGFTDRATRRIDRNGAVIEVNLSMAPLLDAGGRPIGVVSVLTDARAQRRLERLERERRAHKEASRVQDELLGVIGHELRTPLAGLRAMSECLIADDDGLEDSQRQSFIKSIHDEVIRLTDLANNMLEAARLDSGVSRWTWDSVDLEQVCDEALEVIRPLVANDRVTLKCEVQPRGERIRGDQQAIRRLLLNLLSNAVKHTDDGSISLRMREIAGPSHRWVQIQVEDTGRGIPPERTELLGRAFAGGSGAVCSATTSVGLGLAVCREIVAAHGGEMSVQSEPGRGCTMTVVMRSDLELPLEGVELPQITRKSA